MLSRLPKIYICLYNGMFYSNENEQTRATCACLHTKSLQSCLFLWNFMDCTCQAPLSMGFSRQEFWSRLPFPSPGDLPDTGTEPMSLMSPALTGTINGLNKCGSLLAQRTETHKIGPVRLHFSDIFSSSVIFAPGSSLPHSVEPERPSGSSLRAGKVRSVSYSFVSESLWPHGL